ncbi:MAG: hypothetical protein AAF518_15080 [Spirochaetota bacterium]
MNRLIGIFLLCILGSLACSKPENVISDEPVHIHNLNYSFPSPIHHFLLLDKLMFDWQKIDFEPKKSQIHSQEAYALHIGVEASEEIVFILAGDHARAAQARKVILQHATKLEIAHEVEDSFAKFQNLLDQKASKKVLLEKAGHLEEEIEVALVKHGKEPYAVLSDIGSWLEGFHILVKELSLRYDPKLSLILHESHIAELYHEALVELQKSGKLPKKNKLIQDLDLFLGKVKEITLPKKEKPVSLPVVRKLLKLTTEIRKEIREL